MNKTKLIEKIVLLENEGKYEEMELSCRDLLRKQPNSFNALQLLGLALARQGRHADAVNFYKKALNKTPHAGTYNNLGLSYQEIGRSEDSLDSFRRSIKLDPDASDVFNNIGNAYLRLKNYPEAKRAYEQAIRLNSKCREALNNLGLCLRKMGLLHESVEYHLKAHSLDPTSSREFVNLYHALLKSHVTDDALHVAQIGLEVAKSPIDRLELLIGVAIISWLSGQYDLAKEATEKFKFTFSQASSLDKKIKPLWNYYHYITELLNIRSENPDLYQGEEIRNAIFFVGESHCLSPSETIVQYKGASYRVLSTFIQGCKTWHLGREECNEYKKSLEILLKALPPNSKVIIGMGEIDCREDEGIFPAYQDKGIDFRRSIPAIIEAYVEYASLLARQFSHTLIFYGVPAISEKRATSLIETQRELLAQIIELFNFELRKACNRHEWELLDVYAATSTAETSYHIDPHHLHPKTLGILFRSHLLPRDKL